MYLVGSGAFLVGSGSGSGQKYSAPRGFGSATLNCQVKLTHLPYVMYSTMCLCLCDSAYQYRGKSDSKNKHHMLLGHKCPGVLYGITSIFPTDDISSRRNLACRPTVYILIHIYVKNKKKSTYCLLFKKCRLSIIQI